MLVNFKENTCLSLKVHSSVCTGCNWVREVASFLTSSPSSEYHTAEILEKIFHFLEASNIE